MSDLTLISYAQNGEDVVLWRALGHVSNGRYVDVGAGDPVELSVTKALYDRGWRGIDIDAVPEHAGRLRAARPADEVVHAAITDREGETTTFHELVGTGLSTLIEETAEAHEKAGFQRRDITVPVLTLDAVCERSALLEGDLHVLAIDVEGAEAEVLRSFDLNRWRPWVVVVEATRPLSDEPSHEGWDPLLVEAGYTFTLFDGLSRYYASPDHPEIVHALSYPACSLDDYVTVRQHLQDQRVEQLAHEAAQARQDAGRWRNDAVNYWATAVAKAQASATAAMEARQEADRLRLQLSRARTGLQEARQDRKQLRARLKGMAARIELLEQGEEREPPAAGSAGQRLRAAVKKVTRP